MGTSGRFRETVAELGLGSVVEERACFLEDLTSADERFDVATLYNVINHLDEDAVEVLNDSALAIANYVDALKHLRSLMADDGYVIVADCGRRNFWNDVGLRNPLAPTIEWHKHQQPDVWRKVFEQAGFALHDLRWTPLYPARSLTSNQFVHYFSVSHFTLRFRTV